MDIQSHGDSFIRILIADDDERILQCYREVFCESPPSDHTRTLADLGAELFDINANEDPAPKFDVVSCSQGADAISLARDAANGGQPFDIVILDVRMPPGIDGVEAGSEIRKLDSDVEIIFVTGYSDVPRDELERRVPPPARLHYFNKPLSFIKLARNVARIVKAH